MNQPQIMQSDVEQPQAQTSNPELTPQQPKRLRIKKILEKSSRTIGIYPVNLQDIVVAYQTLTRYSTHYTNDQIHTNHKFDQAKVDAAIEYFPMELGMSRVEVKKLHNNSDFDKQLMYVELASVKQVKYVFARVAEMARENDLGV